MLAGQMQEGSGRKKQILNSIQVARHKVHEDARLNDILSVMGMGINSHAVLNRHSQCAWSHWDAAISGIFICHLRTGGFDVLFIFK